MPYVKFVDGEVIYPPINDGDIFNVNLDETWLTEHGYVDKTQEEIDNYIKENTTTVDPEPDPSTEDEPKKYSTLMIIRALGDEWEKYRAKLEAYGYLDQFFAANYLLETDPLFVEFLKEVPLEIRDQLDTCIWNPK